MNISAKSSGTTTKNSLMLLTDDLNRMWDSQWRNSSFPVLASYPDIYFEYLTNSVKSPYITYAWKNDSCLSLTIIKRERYLWLKYRDVWQKDAPPSKDYAENGIHVKIIIMNADNKVKAVEVSFPSDWRNHYDVLFYDGARYIYLSNQIFHTNRYKY